jgi:hypothetical protein
MTADIAELLLPALQIAAFERMADGSFRALAPAPAWFERLGRDGTFPFLGHILEEAVQFWSTRTDGVRQWGPCVEVNERGAEFHYRVKALTHGHHAFLVFELDEAAERIREVLQKVRSDALEAARTESNR